MDPSDYDYSAAGFDGFMSRAIGNVPQVNLDSPTAPNNALPVDRTQVSGQLGDTLQIGKINLNGSDGNIILNDGNTDRLLLGHQDGGF